MSDKNNDEFSEHPSDINPEDIENIKTGFFRTLKKATGQVPFSEEVVASYYCATDPETPLKYKAALVSALAYFVLPIDAIPDVIPGVGFTDDWGILAAAITFASNAITEDHQLYACIWLEKIERCFEILSNKIGLLQRKLAADKISDLDESKLPNVHKLVEKVEQCNEEIDQLKVSDEKSGKLVQNVKRIRIQIQEMEQEYLELI